MQKLARQYKAYLMNAALRLEKWALANEHVDWTLQARAPAAERESRGFLGRKHVWTCHGGRHRCQLCLLGVVDKHSAAARSECPGMPAQFKELARDARGHHLIEYEHGSLFLVACSRCWCWATTSPRSLLQPCQGEERPRAEHDRSRLLRGRHPQSGHILGPMRMASPRLTAIFSRTSGPAADV